MITILNIIKVNVEVMDGQETLIVAQVHTVGKKVYGIGNVFQLKTVKEKLH